MEQYVQIVRYVQYVQYVQYDTYYMYSMYTSYGTACTDQHDQYVQYVQYARMYLVPCTKYIKHTPSIVKHCQFVLKTDTFPKRVSLKNEQDKTVGS